MPTLLRNIDRLIYLDSDLICMSDLSMLWDQNMRGLPVAAVPDASFFRVSDPGCIGFCGESLADPSQLAFNAGVMLIDLEMWRNENVLEQALRFLERYRDQLRNADQDILNFIFAGRWHHLEPNWNVPQFLVEGHPSRMKPIPEFEQFSGRPMSDGQIYHLWGKHKPWNSGPRHVLRLAWLRELRNAGWYSRPRWVAWRVTDLCRAYCFSAEQRLCGYR